MKRYLLPLFLFSSLLLAGCVSHSPHSEFARTITFSVLETFSYEHTLVSGMDFRESEEQMLEKLSKSVLVSEFAARGFDEVETESDFFVVAKWKKEVSSYPNVFDHIDGVQDSMNRRHKPSARFAARLHLTVEVYETSNRKLFWRRELPNVFDAVQFTEGRVTESLQRAVENFPERIERDPDLPDIEAR